MNGLTVLRYITSCIQNIPTEVPKGSKSRNTFGANACVHWIALLNPTANN